jgi:predicted membrane-bound dolichyl-phosphate-mannose-protein mannosyltransferase
MACEYCDHKGYIKIEVLKSASTQGHVRPCPKCNDTKAYYRYIKEKYSNSTVEKKNTEGEVISLQDRRT